LDVAQENALIIHQLKKLISRHATDNNLKNELSRMVREVARSTSNTPLLDFKNVGTHINQA
jgi:hypothetical protein